MTQRFLGCQYPLTKNPRGLMAQRTGVNQIKADLLQLLLTNPGERCMLPTFGVPLRQLIFEPNDSTLEIRARQMIANAIQNWEPRIVPTNIEVTSQVSRDVLNPDDTFDDQPSILYIKISFVDPEDISQIEELKLEVPLGGG